MTLAVSHNLRVPLAASGRFQVRLRPGSSECFWVGVGHYGLSVGGLVQGPLELRPKRFFPPFRVRQTFIEAPRFMNSFQTFASFTTAPFVPRFLRSICIAVRDCIRHLDLHFAFFPEPLHDLGRNFDQLLRRIQLNAWNSVVRIRILFDLRRRRRAYPSSTRSLKCFHSTLAAAWKPPPSTISHLTLHFISCCRFLCQIVLCAGLVFPPELGREVRLSFSNNTSMSTALWPIFFKKMLSFDLGSGLKTNEWGAAFWNALGSST